MARLWLLLPCLTACGGYGSAFSASETLALERCERAFACEGAYPADRSVSFGSLWGADVDACAVQVGPDRAFKDAWKDGEKAGEIRYDKAAAKVCGTAISLTGCDAFWSDAEVDSCADAFAGTVVEDGACQVDAVCASGLCDGGRCVGGPEEEE